jgi:release factor glutamine methyltransferase
VSGETVDELLASVDDLPGHEVERLLQLAGGRSRADLLLDMAVSEDAARDFRRYVERRRSGEPLQYIEGTVQFGPVELAVDRRALIPRPETEQLWDRVVRRLTAPPRVLVDLCTGSGNLALAFKHTWPEARVIATDLSPDALSLADENVRRTGLDVELYEGDLFDAVPLDVRGEIDVLVANPPYLADDELATLDDEVREHEPPIALVAGREGDEVLARLAGEAPRWVRPGGLVACEISEFQADRTRALFAVMAGEVVADLTGRPRFLFAAVPS